MVHQNVFDEPFLFSIWAFLVILYSDADILFFMITKFYFVVIKIKFKE